MTKTLSPPLPLLLGSAVNEHVTMVEEPRDRKLELLVKNPPFAAKFVDYFLNKNLNAVQEGNKNYIRILQEFFIYSRYSGFNPLTF